MKFQKTRPELEAKMDEIRVMLSTSLSKAGGKVFIPRLPRAQYSYSPLIARSEVEVPDSIHVLQRVDWDGVVYAVDASIVPLAESVDGVVMGVRSAVVEYNMLSGSTRVRIDGPHAVYLYPELLSELARLTVFHGSARSALLGDLGMARRVLLSVYEYSVIARLVGEVDNGVVLIDGLLGHGVVRSDVYRYVVEEASRRGVHLVGVSKRSRLVKRHISLLNYFRSMGIDGFSRVRGGAKGFHTYLGFLNVSSGYPFRIDISIGSDEAVLDIVYSLPSNPTGYPSVLVEAHTLSKLGAKDIIGLMFQLASSGVKLKMSMPYRPHVLGSVEGGRDEGV